MSEFMTFDNLLDYVTLIGVVLALVQVTKDIKGIQRIATKYWSIIVAFILIILTNMNFNTFKMFDLIVYLINAVFISLSANGTYEFARKVE